MTKSAKQTIKSEGMEDRAIAILKSYPYPVAKKILEQHGYKVTSLGTTSQPYRKAQKTE